MQKYIDLNLEKENISFQKDGVMMDTSKEYRDVVLEKCNLLDLITCRAMMGEYLLYYNKILFGGIYNERFLIKIVDENKKYKLKEKKLKRRNV